MSAAVVDDPGIAAARQIILDHLAATGRAVPAPIPRDEFVKPRPVPVPIPIEEAAKGTTQQRFSTLTLLLVESGDLTPDGRRRVMQLARSVA